jgi:hypothetical protein
MSDLIELTEKTEHFDFCTFVRNGEPDPNVVISANGTVICPPEHGNWSGKLEWREDGYWLTFTDPRVKPHRVPVYFDAEAAEQRMEQYQEQAAYFTEKADWVYNMVMRHTGDIEDIKEPT